MNLKIYSSFIVMTGDFSRRHTCSVIFVLFALLIPVPVNAQQQARLPEAEEYVYKTAGRTDLHLYLYKPALSNTREKLPAIVFFHGGAWAGGQAWQFKPQCSYLASRGMVAITAEYRVRKRNRATPLDCVADAKSAMRWVRAHAEELGIDETRIAAGGGSSGGHLAASCALVEGFDEPGDDKTISPIPDALVLFNPVLDVPGVVHKLPGKVQQVLEGRAMDISPAHNPDADAPPVLILHGTEDSSVPFGQAKAFYGEMKKLGVYCRLVPYEGREHGFFNYEKGENPDFFSTMDETTDFLVEIGFLETGKQDDFFMRLSSAAIDFTSKHVIYDHAYFSIHYPGGDIPSDKGVCTDVIIRAYRSLGIDLQKEVHEDMAANFHLYPKNWGLTKPDPNIDHRRVPNLMTFFSRHGTTLPASRNSSDYLPGDIVCWDLGKGITHIGFVADIKPTGADRYQVVHNIGQGQVVEDCLFSFKIIGHYRYSKD